MATSRQIASAKARLKRVADKRGLAAHIPERRRQNKARTLEPAEVTKYFNESENEMDVVLDQAVEMFRRSGSKK